MVNWEVPLFKFDIGSEEIEAVVKILRTGWLSMGNVTEEFESKFAEKLRVKHAVAVSSCTAALHLALLCCGIKEGDEVIVPSLTFVATVNAVKYANAKPVFADIESLDSPNIDPQDIKRKITNRTKAVIVVHYAGYPAKISLIAEIATTYGLKIIEDAAHAVYLPYNGKPLGTWGDAGCFSFFANKNITTAEGGMLVTNSDQIAKRARLLRSHGMTTLSFDRFKGHASYYDVVDLGYNYRIDDIRSAIGLVQLTKLDKIQMKRKELVKIYWEKLSQIDEIIIPFKESENSAFHIQPIVIGNKINRDAVREYMHKQGIQTSIHYKPVHLFSIYKEDCHLPITENYSSKEITLPLYPSMNEKKVLKVVRVLKEAIMNSRKKS